MRILRSLKSLDSPGTFTWQTWVVAYAPSVSTAVLHDRNLYGGTLFEWLVVAIIGTLGAGAVLLVAHFVLRNWHPVVVILTTFFVAGCIRGLGVGWSAELLELVPDPQWGVRALSGGILGVFWLSVAALIVDGFRRHRLTRVELEDRELHVQQENRAAVKDLSRLDIRTRVEITEEISRIARDLHVAVTYRSSADLRADAGRLHDLSAQVVRPLSHEVAVTRPRDIDDVPQSKRRGYSTILRDSVTVDPFRPGWTLALLFPSILLTAIRGYGVVLGALGALWIAGMAALVLTAAEHGLGRHFRSLPLALRAVTVVVVWFTAAAASALPVAVSSASGLGPVDAWDVFGIPLFVYVPVMCLGLAIAGAISKAWAMDEDTRLSRIESLQWQTQRLRQQIWAERTRLGRFLHGSVQASLTSTALLIESRLSAGDDPSDIASAASARLGDLLDSMNRLGADHGSTTSVIDVLDRIVAVWSRLADITVTVDSAAEDAFGLDDDAAEVVVEIAREGITNAIKHGGADQIRVHVSADRTGLSLTVRDNGRWTSSTTTGLGTALLDSLCTEWSREPRGEGGTLLTCLIPAGRQTYAPV
jgi:signal transduction histidine kinase